MKMVDKNVEFKIGDRIICPQGQLLNLTAEEAVEIIPPLEHPLLATSIVDDIPGLLANRQIQNHVIKTFTPHSAEKLAYWITLLSPILMAAAFIGIYIEFKTPGFGLPGIIGSISLVLFLFGHYIAGLAGKEDIFLVILGITLLLVEVFILPGFGFCGLLGIAALLGGMIMAMIPLFPTVPNLPSDFGSSYGNMDTYINSALINLVITITISAIAIYLLAKFLPKTKFYGSIVLLTTQTPETGYIATNIEENTKLIGKTGIAITTLRPAGLVDIEGKRIDVISNGDYIDKGELVEVIKVDGPSIIVEKRIDLSSAQETPSAYP
jgi:membrane-bound serine protease (ClpP class)